jgi:hypothetical protein
MGSTLELAVRLVISMAVVMAVMALAARFVRHRQGLGTLPKSAGAGAPAMGNGLGGRGRRPRPAPPVEVVYRRSLAKGAAVSVVQATGRTFLLGVTEQSVTLLAELPTTGVSAATGVSAGTGVSAATAATTAPVNANVANPALVGQSSTGGGHSGPSIVGNDSPNGFSGFGSWEQDGRMPFGGQGTAAAETSDHAWKLALDSLRERTVRR